VFPFFLLSHFLGKYTNFAYDLIHVGWIFFEGIKIFIYGLENEIIEEGKLQVGLALM
jgi:hypothetical protein